MPLKTWVDYERLEAADLNAAFAWSQEMTMPGAHSMTDGATTASVAISAYGECKHGAPAAGGDPLGIYRSSDGRLVIPVAGVWLYRSILRAEDNTTNDPVQCHITLDAGRVQIASLVRRSGTQITQTCMWMAPMVAGQVLYMEARSMVSAGTFGLRAWSIIRLARGFGGVGAVASAFALEQALDARDQIDTSLPEAEA